MLCQGGVLDDLLPALRSGQRNRNTCLVLAYSLFGHLQLWGIWKA